MEDQTNRLEEIDYLRLLLANREVDLLETQIELYKSKLDSSKRALGMLSGMMRQKYNLTQKDVVDLSTGEIQRAPANSAALENEPTT